MLFSRFEVKIDGDNLTATAWGEPVDNEKHKTAVEVKAATYTELAVKKDTEGNWLAQCVVDV
jgi:SHS2 domain-containing protein